MDEREYIVAIRRGLNRIALAMDEPPGLKRRVLILEGAISVLQAHERFTGAVHGSAAILKPLILFAVENGAEHGGFVRAFLVAVEGKYHLAASATERRARV